MAAKVETARAAMTSTPPRIDSAEGKNTDPTRLAALLNLGHSPHVTLERYGRLPTSGLSAETHYSDLSMTKQAISNP
ncbi:hypothetical protein AB0N87_43360 [Streptomyces sp. NPDC093228]|uniref:hypothetical protein n=1 Tax=Streptomyces sp. NPDC093228 TaxID=3155070 RepID=UPI00344A7385